ncbi:CMSS1-like protein [Drosera capensis]
MADESKPSKRKRVPLDPSRPKTKKSKNKALESNAQSVENENGDADVQAPVLSAAEQLRFFLDQYQSALGVTLSSLDLESIKDTCILKLPEDVDQDANDLGKHIKDAFGSSWRHELSEGKLVEGTVAPGSPAVLVISSSAIRSLELLRGLRSLTEECPPVKLFSKHIKVEDQVSLLKNRVNIGSGTPSRIKKLCEMDALGLSRLKVLILDMHSDAKGYSLFTLPQVRDEFWDLYKTYLHQRLVQGDMRICLCGPIPVVSISSKTKSR